jgi:hypothetical protein
LTATINSASSTLVGTVDTALTYNQIENSTYFKFFSNQPGLTGTMKHDVQVFSGAFTTPSTKAVWTVTLLSCTQKYRDWIPASTPV